MPAFALLNLSTTESFPLGELEIVLVGRNESAQVVVRDTGCSRSHFQLRKRGNDYWLEPLADHNPTLLDDTPVTGSVLLKAGAIIKAGNTRFEFQRLDFDRTEAMPEVKRSGMHETVYAAPRQTGKITTGETIPIHLGRRTIGRDQSADVVLAHPQVSRLHAAVTVREKESTLRDLGSANGTFINGRRLASGREVKLEPGDQVDIGPYGLEFQPGKLEPRSRLNNIELVATSLNRTVTDRQTGKPLVLLDDVSLVIRPKEFVCLLGPSGSGKSTLMNVLAGRVKPDEGAVMVNGKHLHANFEALKTDLAFVPQKDVMHDKLTVGQALSFTALLRLPPDLSRKERLAGVDEILETVSLQSRKGTMISNLSGGQIKRASLANEILSKPSLLFLDEVTSGLDEQTDREMMALFRRVADDGKTVVCITHSLANVEGFCDLVVVLTPGGKLAFVGKPAEALVHFGVERLGDVYVKLGVAKPAVWEEKFRASPHYQKYVVERLQAVAPAPRVKAAEGPQLVKKAEASVRQGFLLTLRYLLIWKGSPGALLSMVGQTLLVSALLIGLFGDLRELDDLKKMTRSENLLFLLAVSAFWFGCNNAAKELVKERIIFQRERDYNLLTGSYLASKMGVLAVIGLMQVVLLFALVKWWCDPPGALLGQCAMLMALSLAGTALGLAISAASGSEEVAIALIPIAVIPQIILSGAISPLSGFVQHLARIGVTTYWGKRGLDQLLPEHLFDLAKTAEFAESGEYWIALGMTAFHALMYTLIALVILYYRGLKRK